MNEKMECKTDGIKHVDLLIKLPNDKRGVISGKVVDKKNCPIKDAVVGLFELVGDKRVPETCKTSPAAFCFTDHSGEFVFGPICPDKDYVVKAWKNITKTKCEKLEINADCDCLKGIDCQKKDDDKKPHKPSCDHESCGCYDKKPGKPSYDHESCGCDSKNPYKPAYEPEFGGYGD